MEASKRSYMTLIESCEADLRSGQIGRVQARLSQINTAKIPRDSRRALANVCWRAGLTSLGLKVLHPLVHQQKNRLARQASDEEKAEYAILLTRTGATTEARRILESIPAATVPDALLYRAFCHFSQWEHRLAIPLLEAYCDQQITDYKKLIGRVNLAAAFVACDRYQEALDLLSSNIEMAKSAGHSRLLANCYEIRGQVYVHQRSFELAKDDLATAKATLGAVKTYDQLFIRKWTSLLEAIKSGDLQPIIEFRKEALLRHEAESVREADRFHLRVEFDDEIYHRLIFGTPAVDYRTRLMAEHSGASVRDSYVFGDASGALLDLASGKLHNAPKGFDLSELSPGRKVHQLLEVLTRDFYRPMRIGALFAELFPNEYFDVYSSPNRVHAWLWHLRQWFTRMSLPLEIVEIRGTYLLKYSAEPSSHFGIEVPLNRERPDAQLLLWQDFAAKMGDGPFTAKSAEATSRIARTSLQRLINWAINSGRLVREKQGVQVFYRLVDPAQSRKPTLSAA